MASMFNTLSIGYSGLSAAQVEINTTGHNIANAETEGYTRQRVMTSAATPIAMRPGQVGNGVEVQDIKRVFDNFVFDRYNAVSADKENSDTQRQTLETLSTYFPEIDGVGVKADMQKYYDSWQTFADNPDNDSVKVALAKQSETLASHIKETQTKVLDLQKQTNEQIAANVNQVNDLAKQLADVNLSINNAENGGGNSANDLRDKRNVLERSLSKLIGANVNQGQLEANIQVDSNSNTRTGSYTLSVNGFNIVDGNTFHPLHLENKSNKFGFYDISYERQDGTLIPMNEEIKGGKIGALLNLRGAALDTTSGMPVDGTLQKTVSDLDAFAKGLIEGTNNLYAQSASTHKESNGVELSDSTPLVNSKLSIKQGSFDVVVYDIDGNEVASRKINIDSTTSMSNTDNSIKAQIKANKDDNGDNNATNDIDDYMEFNYDSVGSGENILDLSVNSDAASKGYTFSIKDNYSDGSFNSGTNFAGALGLGRYFDGNNARDIQLNDTLRNNPTLVHAGYSSSGGDNNLALDMTQQQFEKYDFNVATETYNTTLYGMFDTTSTFVGVSTNSAVSRNDTVTAQFNATEMEYNSVSKVSIDEEMTNLIKYQTSYGAAAKVITTVDQMMQTLLGIKQ
ncbi:flagellar hook-associated protein FlgK [Sulfurimonas sp.]|uniref:flagellar hook-associated protein FlgK n=1 Tax=Sulfurimonas sp. TaxID=2022749 RepID=UPI00261A28D1|nr:flagellar hook-associated protein FlgK [Sulfurimonas sp.]